MRLFCLIFLNWANLKEWQPFSIIQIFLLVEQTVTELWQITLQPWKYSASVVPLSKQWDYLQTATGSPPVNGVKVAFFRVNVNFCTSSWASWRMPLGLRLHAEQTALLLIHIRHKETHYKRQKIKKIQTSLTSCCEVGDLIDVGWLSFTMTHNRIKLRIYLILCHA